MKTIRTIVAGADGRMGRALIRAIAATKDLTLMGALVRTRHSGIGQDAGTLSGSEALGVSLSNDAPAALARADVLLDFTAPDYSAALAALAAKANVAHIIGTTGFSRGEENAIARAAKDIAIVKSGNMSMGVTLLAALSARAARALSEFDIEIVEMHHRGKADAPSGTALLLGRAVAQARGIALDENRIDARAGRTGARRKGAIGFASLRGGTVVGEHDVILAGAGERVVLRHVAEDRAIFAHGALTAARWAARQKPGLYSMADVLGLSA